MIDYISVFGIGVVAVVFVYLYSLLNKIEKREPFKIPPEFEESEDD